MLITVRSKWQWTNETYLREERWCLVKIWRTEETLYTVRNGLTLRNAVLVWIREFVLVAWFMQNCKNVVDIMYANSFVVWMFAPYIWIELLMYASHKLHRLMFWFWNRIEARKKRPRENRIEHWTYNYISLQNKLYTRGILTECTRRRRCTTTYICITPHLT